METRARALGHLVDVSPRAPGEGIVERVEVGTLRDRRAAFVDRPVFGDVVALQARRSLDRRAVADSPLRRELALHAARRVRAFQRLRNGQRPFAQLGLAGTERRRYTLTEVEVQVPRLEILEEV